MILTMIEVNYWLNINLIKIQKNIYLTCFFQNLFTIQKSFQPGWYLIFLISNLYKILNFDSPLEYKNT